MAGNGKKWFQKLGASIANRFATVETAVGKLEPMIVVDETITINAGGNKAYSVAALIGATANLYDLTKLELVVRVQDSEVGSTTNGFLINPEGVLTYGVKADGSVRIVNNYTGNLSTYVRITVPKK